MSLYSHPGAGWSIRHWRRDDYPQIEVIFRECLTAFPWRASVREEVLRLRQALSANIAFVAEEKSAGVVGFLTLEQGKAYVPHVFVDGDWRFCGVGSGLLQVARNFVGRPLQLDVDIQNAAAIEAYTALGWKERAKVGRGAREQVRLVGP
ncbi:MAG: GNAT family N-acetyltransferase [Hyphomonas sp.]|nr:GNAT family N-acetyltransferase [Hyphomonas sp.]